MSYLINILMEFTQADGTPFRTPKRDKDKNLVERKDDKGNVMMGLDGTAVIEMEDAGFEVILRNFLNGIFKVSEQRKALAIQAKKDIKPEHDLVMEDSAYATDVFRALNVAIEGTFALEKAPYAWVLRQIETWGVDLYGINAAVLKGVFEGAEDTGTTRAEQHREKNGKKDEVEIPRKMDALA
jgi:hypothetical protein